MATKDTVKRSITKSITFRILILIADAIIIYALTGNLYLAASVIIFSNISSTIIYFFHERFWGRITWGRRK